MGLRRNPLRLEGPDTLTKTFHDGDWISHATWVEDRWLVEAAGFTAAQLARARDALARLYPPDIAREMVKDPHRGGFIAPLFFPDMPFLLPPLIELGLDAAEVEIWTDPRRLARLQNRDQWVGQAYELGLAAALRRHAVTYDWLSAEADKGPDFTISWGHRRYYLEATALQPTDVEWLAGEALQAFGSSLSSHCQPGTVLSCNPSKDFAERCLDVKKHESVRRDFPAVVDAFIQRSRELPSNLPVGKYPVPPWGEIALREAPEYERGAVEIRVVPTQSAWKRAKRVADAAKSKARQLRRDGVGIILVACGAIDLRELWRHLCASQATDSRVFKTAGLLVVKAVGSPLNQSEGCGTAMFPVGNHKPSLEERSLIQILSSVMVPEDPARPHPLTTMVRGSTLTLSPGEAGKVTISPPPPPSMILRP